MKMLKNIVSLTIIFSFPDFPNLFYGDVEEDLRNNIEYWPDYYMELLTSVYPNSLKTILPTEVLQYVY